MMNRLKMSRELAGLSLNQAATLLGWKRDELAELERPESQAGIGELTQLSALYGVTKIWLRGCHVELPDATERLLQDIECDSDRAKVRVLLLAIQGERV